MGYYLEFIYKDTIEDPSDTSCGDLPKVAHVFCEENLGIQSLNEIINNVDEVEEFDELHYLKAKDLKKIILKCEEYFVQNKDKDIWDTNIEAIEADFEDLKRGIDLAIEENAEIAMVYA